VTRIDRAVAARCAPRSAIAAQGSDGERTFETQLRQTGATGWIREFQFELTRGWRFDFAWPDVHVAVEIEGGQWIGGHGGTRFEQDCVKYAEAAIGGWLVLRVTTDMVEDGRAVALLGRALWSASQRGRSR
jgi:very-short-patch-repair endonuclease